VLIAWLDILILSIGVIIVHILSILVINVLHSLVNIFRLNILRLGIFRFRSIDWLWLRGILVHWGVFDGLLGFLEVVVGELWLFVLVTLVDWLRLWLWLLVHHLSV
jgi:hypothetical protein